MLLPKVDSGKHPFHGTSQLRTLILPTKKGISHRPDTRPFLCPVSTSSSSTNQFLLFLKCFTCCGFIVTLYLQLSIPPNGDEPMSVQLLWKRIITVLLKCSVTNSQIVQPRLTGVNSTNRPKSFCLLESHRGGPHPQAYPRYFDA